MLPRLRSKTPSRPRGPWWWLLVTIAFLAIWAAATFAAEALAWDGVCSWLVTYGLAGLFFIGLGWTIWVVERISQRCQKRRRARAVVPRRVWNPLDQDAWYYGRSNGKLNQSVAALLLYALLFFLLVAVFRQWWIRGSIYELPGGGGQAKALPQTIRVQKIIRTKYVVNPFSAIKFNVPPIDDVKLRLDEATEHAYTVGYGEGSGGPGFGTGTARGKVRFIRLQYSGGDWDQDFGIGADLNMLLEYGIRTGQKVADKTESRTIDELRGFPLGKSPPVVYLTGEKNISVSQAEIKVLREYLLKKHGMLFGDNGGSAHFHHQFLALMAAVLPEVRPVRIPLDDAIHRIPYHMPFLPYVAPHGGKDALGWWLDGRWVCYYHPGDIADAWCDGHAGIKPEVWECCYQLGTNIIFYAHVEYAKWLESQQRSR